MADETVTVSKQAYETLLKIQAMSNKAWESKTEGAAFRRMLKNANPELNIPDDLAESAIAPVKGEVDEARKEVKGLGEKLDKFLGEFKDKEDMAAMRTAIADAKKKYGLDDEGESKMIQRMKDKNNPDVESAAAFIASQAPKPQIMKDHGISSIGADLFGTTKQSDEFKDLQTGGDPFRPGGWFDRKAEEVLNEPTEQAA